MNNTYQPVSIEEKWQQAWAEADLFQHTMAADQPQPTSIKKTGSQPAARVAVPSSTKLAQNPKKIDKLYLLFAFAYPSGSGLHVGHVESKTALDILARYQRMHGKEVFFPVGWDAFGLPAENYAIKTGVPPAQTTKQAIDTFRRQIKRLGISYDWATEIATCHPKYYRWTQWLFSELYRAGLAVKKTGMVNWCPSCQTVLANEQVVDGHCERCESAVIQQDLEQWFFKITNYQDELISGLDQLDWPTPTKHHQLNWIGKSQGSEVIFGLQAADGQPLTQQVTCFTTRIDTIYGVTYVVISPEKFKEMNLIKLVTADRQKAVTDYLDQAFHKTEEERQIGEKDKTGQDTGLKAINPVNGQPVPLLVADYVLSGVGTGVVMGVPAHDTRDNAFARKHQLPIIEVIVPQAEVAPQKAQLVQPAGQTESAACLTDDGVLINSGEFNGLASAGARKAIVNKFSQVMKPTTTYKLRDWLISRQRYWGAPIPVIYDPAGQAHLIADQDLPWLLPIDVDFKPTGESPLKSSVEFQQRTANYARDHFADLIKAQGWAADGSDWRPEYDTMDTFVDSSWYYLRYLDARNDQQLADPKQLANWLPVDLYLIGPEHIVLHLLYSRFLTKFLRDRGYLSLASGEPFQKMRHQGMILGPDHRKMSKSKGNVINPDEIVNQFGADTLRVYEMFMGPLEADKPWDDRAVQGVFKFLSRYYRLVQNNIKNLPAESVETTASQARKVASASQPVSSAVTQQLADLQHQLHRTLKKVTADLPAMKFNTAIAVLMELVNAWQELAQVAPQTGFSRPELEMVVKMVAPLAPFMAEELWQQLGNEFSVHQQSWPEFDQQLAQAQQVILPVQVNGKLRGELAVAYEVAHDSKQSEQIIAQAKELTGVKPWLAQAQVVKEIFIPGKIISLVVKPQAS